MSRILAVTLLLFFQLTSFAQQFSNGKMIGSKGFTYGAEARFINYNKDKFPDILAYPFIHINDGKGNRVETIQFATAENMETLGVGDFNNDGLDDVVVLHKSGKLKIFMNSRKGLKEEEQDAKIGYFRLRYSDIYIADINADRNMDILINRFGDDVMIFVGNGKGQFQKSTALRKSFGDFGFVISKDIDGDGVDEIISDYAVVKNTQRNRVVKIRNYINGAYVEKGVYRLHSGVDVFHIADIDSDGDLDFIYSFKYKNGIYWNERDANGNYHKIHEIKTAKNPVTFFLADMDGDKDLDIVKNTRSRPGVPSVDHWIENVNKGSFSEEKPISPRHGSAYLMVADLNDDGLGDLAEFSSANGFRISVGLNAGSTFEYQDDWVITGAINDFDFLDINNDGIKDIIAASRHRLYYFPVSKKGKISDAIPIAQNKFFFTKILLTDMNNDGLLDVFWRDRRTRINRVGWYKNLGMGRFEPQEVQLVNTNVVEADVIDFDGDNDMDIVTYEIGGKLRGFYVYLNENGAFNTSPVTVTESDKFKQLFVFDANLDGKQDIIDLSKPCECYSYSKDKKIETFKVPFLEKCYGFYRNLLMVDIDGDNSKDVVFDERYKLHWTKVTKNSQIQSVKIIEESPSIEKLVYSGDIDNDGDIDFLYRSSDYVMVDAESFTNKYKLMWLENDGTGYFTPHFIGKSSGNSWRIKLHDIDGDGDLDAFQPHRKWSNYGLFMYKNNEKK